MPYSSRIHLQQDPEFKIAQDRVKMFNAFYTTVLDSAFPEKPQWADGVPDDLVFYLQSQLAQYRIFPGVGSAQFYSGAHNPARE